MERFKKAKVLADKYQELLETDPATAEKYKKAGQMVVIGANVHRALRRVGLK